MTKKEKKANIQKLISDIHYQSYVGVSTWGFCENNCNKTARGSRVCLVCLTNELELLVGSQKARDYTKAINLTKKLEHEFNQKYEIINTSLNRSNNHSARATVPRAT